MKGEPQFRIMERFCLLQALTQGYHILSSGGGTPCFFDNMSLINKYCFSIYLKSTKPLLTREMQEGMHPVFKNGPVVEKWNDLLQKRSIYYERAHLIQNAYASEPNVLEAVSSFCLKENIIKVKL
jgi:shikimate kinase